MRRFVPSILVTLVATAVTVRAQVKPYISTETEYNTECKTCPRSLCPNQIAYGYNDALNVTCWTRGTKIMGDELWLKTEAGCYVTQYDVLEYDGDCESFLPIAALITTNDPYVDTTDLEYCGAASEIQDLTIEDAKLKYKTECRICPELSCDLIAYLKEDTELELTCWYPEGQLIIDDP